MQGVGVQAAKEVQILDVAEPTSQTATVTNNHKLSVSEERTEGQRAEEAFPASYRQRLSWDSAQVHLSLEVGSLPLHSVVCHSGHMGLGSNPSSAT